MPALKTLLFTLVVPGTAVGIVPYVLVRTSGKPMSFPSGWPAWLGFAPLLVGIAMYAWCATEFAVRGRGTPAPIDPPKKLVAGGLYRCVRNPMYLGVLSILLGEAMLLRAGVLLVYGLCLFALFHIFVIAYEEPTLRATFGDAYREYCARVPRWLPRSPRS